ncbi:Exocyst complex component sec6, partial [Thalictrum thalictroides]
MSARHVKGCHYVFHLFVRAYMHHEFLLNSAMLVCILSRLEKSLEIFTTSLLHRCYDLAMELSSSTMEALPQNYAEQVNFEDTCKGFLEVAKEAVRQTVSVIFEDPGVQELLAKLYQK